MLKCQRLLGRRGDTLIKRGELRRDKAHGARYRLAVNEQSRFLGCLQGSGSSGWNLDEVAQNVVVLHLERLDAGHLAIAGLQPGNHMARFIAQRAVLVEIGGVALLHEATVASENGQIDIEGVVELSGEIKIAPAQRLANGIEVLRQPADGHTGAQPVGKMASDHQGIADSGQIARATTGDCHPAKGALEVRHGGQQLANIIAQGGIGNQMRNVVEPVGDGIWIAQGVRQT